MKYRSVATLSLIAVLASCAGDPAAEDRDLSLPSAEAVTALNDVPEDSTDIIAGTQTPPTPAPTPTPPRPARPRTPTPPPAPPTVAAGAGFLAFAYDTIASGHNQVGDTVMASIGEDVQDANGKVVIPAGAFLFGTVTELAPAETPGGEGKMSITYTDVSIGDSNYEIMVTTDSLGTYTKGRGVTAGDAAKVGAGAVLGGLAGRILGGNSRGTAIGAAAGAAAGVGIAAATRDVDIILDAGAAIFLTITSDFVLTPLSN